MTRSVARLLAESLDAHDVDQVFCVPGESYVGLINALTDMNSLRLIVCRHEGGAGFMAVADGRLRNRAGCCIVSRGPGLSNAMVSLHSAYHDATPMVMLVGQVERKDFGRMALIANPLFEKVLSGVGHNQGFEFGYRNAIYYRWLRYLSPGVEFYGGVGLLDNTDPLQEQQHYIFAVLWGELPNGIEYNIGPGFGLTPNSDHVVVKFNIELEKYLGALFGPSSDNSWFF